MLVQGQRSMIAQGNVLMERFRLLFLVNVGFSCMSLALPLLNRFELYFWPFSLSYILNTYPKLGTYQKLGVCLVFVLWAGYQLVSFYIRPEWYGIYPYSFR